MSDFAETQWLIPAVSDAIARYKALIYSNFITGLVGRGFRLTGDEANWLPLLTPDAG